MKSLKIKEWAQDDRPREKMMQHGTACLSDAELLAIIIGSGTKSETAVDVAKQLLACSNNSLGELGKKSIKDFVKIKGIGTAKAVSIAAALELGRRRRNDNNNMQSIKSSRDVFEIFQPLLGDLSHEEFWIMLLNRANKIISKHKVGQGGVFSASVDIKIIAKYATENLAAGVVILHNHPSQNLKPSKNDEKITAEIKSALNLFDIRLVDHLIVSGNAYFSFADEGLL
ncbi:MAG: DNA repair protein RadC [Prevotellaceae bacterium]|jgi:DNA repair protein RadC|nr:DNA repair protein RadC [Prevotellaceae bacterium]